MAPARQNALTVFVTSVTDNLGRATRASYDELNRPSRIVGPAYTDRSPGSPTFNTQICPVTRSFYDTLGRLTHVSAGYTPGPGGVCGGPAQDLVWPQMTYAYDDFGRKLKDIDGLNRAWVYRYDANNNLVQATDPRGQSTTLTYGYGGEQSTQRMRPGR